LSRFSTPSILRNISPRSAAAFGAGFIVSLVVLAFTAISTLGDGAWFQPSDNFVVGVLIGNGVLIFILAVVVGVRLRRRVRGRRFGEPAPRLHMRFVALFSIATAVPAILSAVFLGAVLNRGVDFWFGERVNTLVETASRTAFEVYNSEAEVAISRMRYIEDSINHEDAVETFTSSRIQFNTVLAQVTAIAGLDAAYIVDGRGTILAEVEFREDEVYIPPNTALFSLADSGEPGVTTPEFATRAGNASGEDAMRVLFRLDAFEDEYLYVSHAMDMSLWRDLGDANEALRSSQAEEAAIRMVFITLYFELAALFIVGSIWLALSAATRVVAPISRLVAAAERVRRGDLDARVQMTREDDEITALGRAFNRMTRQLRTQRRELIESHAESEQRRAFSEAVLAGVSAGVIGLDGSNKVTLINRSAVGLLSPEMADPIHAELEEVAPELTDIVLQARRHPGIVAESQIDLEGPDEQARHLTARATMDEEAGLVITFDDVTRLVAAQRNAAWRDVARRIAHEIKNPLTPIQLSAERLQRKYRKDISADVETFDRCTETIIRQVSDIGRMVDEFSSFARMPQPLAEDVEMGEMTQAAVFAQRVASPRIDFSYSRPDVDITACCDERLVSQALANILKNASESVISRLDKDLDEGESGQIDVQLRDENGFAVIEVSDNGLGWPTANRERLTEPYMTTREKGTGLGLAIVKRVMEDHNGRLELGVPASGAGAIVRLVFPLAEADATTTEHEQEA
jgi:two-component system nitrogen regulation sensor histidine kinase NtrY